MTNLIKTEAEQAAQNAAALSAEQQQQQSTVPQETQPVAQEPPQQPAVVVEQPPAPVAPKPKVDFTATDATIQGLSIQIMALQHNKIQQLQQQE